MVHTMLNDSWLKAQHRKPREKELVIADRDGLYARVSLSGGISFLFRFRFQNKPDKMTIGAYPFTTLKEARDRVEMLKGHIDRGTNPKAAWRAAKTQESAKDLLSDVFAEWMEKDGKNKKKNHGQITATFALHVMPVLGNQSVGEISLQQWLDILEELAKTTPSIAERVLTNAKQMYRWLLRRQRVEKNPLSEMSAWNDLGVKKKNSYRSLSDDELRLTIEAIHATRMTGKNKVFMRLCLLFGCRPSELRESLKIHFDFEVGVWAVPPENHKMGGKTGKPLKRPITPLARELLNEAFAYSAGSQYSFLNSTDGKMMTRSSVLPLPYGVMQWVKRHKGISMDHWSIYDLRKTARTNWSTLTQPHIAEIMLGHKLPGEWQVYDQYDYLEEQRKAYQLWGDRLVDLFGF